MLLFFKKVSFPLSLLEAGDFSLDILCELLEVNLTVSAGFPFDGIPLEVF